MREGEGQLVDQQTYREAMARLGAAVNVITTTGPSGRRGFTASAVCSVTDAPPTLLVCLNRASDSNLALKENRILCVNTLAAQQQALSPIFGGLTDDDNTSRFATANWGELVTGAPVLEGALVSFDCRVSEWTEIGTHSVFFCQVEAICGVEGGAGLIYFGRNYHRVQIG